MSTVVGARAGRPLLGRLHCTRYPREPSPGSLPSEGPLYLQGDALVQVGGREGPPASGGRTWPFTNLMVKTGRSSWEGDKTGYWGAGPAEPFDFFATPRPCPPPQSPSPVSSSPPFPRNKLSWLYLQSLD